MTNIEYLFQAAPRARFDRTAPGEALRFREEQLRVAEWNACTDAVAIEDVDEIVSMFDGGNDRQTRAQIVDGLGRNAEAGHTWNGRRHPDVACAEQFEKIVTRERR